MTKYRVSFEVEGYEWRDWSNGSRKELKLDSSLNKGSTGLVIVPAYAEIEEIPEPFEAGYYGAYLNDELCWVKQFNSAEDLEWSKSYTLPGQEIKPVDIIAKNAVKPLRTYTSTPAPEKVQVSTLEGFSVGDFVRIIGHKDSYGAVGIVEEIDPTHKTRPIKVRLKMFGLFQYALDHLAHTTSRQYDEWNKNG